MKLRERITAAANKAKDWLHQAIKDTTPVLKDEISKAAESLSSEAGNEALRVCLKVAMGIGTIYAMSMLFTSGGGKEVADTLPRTLSIVYNEVKIDSLTINLKGE